MSKKKVVIKFQNLYQLWQFAQSIHASSIEIKTQERLLICDCSEDQLRQLEKYSATVMELSM